MQGVISSPGPLNYEASRERKPGIFPGKAVKGPGWPIQSQGYVGVVSPGG